MFERFTKDAREVVNDAVEVARELGAPTVEAEHLLLAVTHHEDGGPQLQHAKLLRVARLLAWVNDLVGQHPVGANLHLVELIL